MKLSWSLILMMPLAMAASTGRARGDNGDDPIEYRNNSFYRDSLRSRDLWRSVDRMNERAGNAIDSLRANQGGPAYPSVYPPPFFVMPPAYVPPSFYFVPPMARPQYTLVRPWQPQTVRPLFRPAFNRFQRPR